MKKRKDYKNMKIKELLKNGFITIIVLAFLLGINSIYSITSNGLHSKQASADGISKTLFVQNLKLQIKDYESNVYKSLAARKIDDAIAILDDTEASMDAIMEQMASYADSISEGTVKEHIGAIVTSYNEVDVYMNEMQELVAAHNRSDLYTLIETSMGPLFDEMIASTELMEEGINSEIASKDFMAMFRGITATIFNVIFLGAILFISIRKTLTIVKTITEPLEEVEDAMNRLAEGDFSVDITYESDNEFGVLADKVRNTIYQLKHYIKIEEEVLYEMANMNMNVSIDEEFKGDFAPMKDSIEKIIVAMNQMVLKTRTTAEVIDGASEHVSSVAQALAESATEQAASVEELVATLHQITSDVTENARMAEQMNVTTKAVNQKMDSGKACMDELQYAMSQISVKSEDISKIISVINDIATQTNLLSLNAAIEASRAGEFGKGFGVVATEIGKLAGQCTEAVKSTEALVEESLKAVSVGTEKVNESMQIIGEIVVNTEENSRYIEELSAVCGQQAAALEQTLAGSNQIAGAIQENTSMAEESSASSEELTAQVTELNAMLQKCIIRENIA